MSDYTPPDPYSDHLATLRAAESKTPIHPKQAADDERLRLLGINYSADMIAANEILREKVAADDARMREAAERLGVPVHELRFACDDDFDARPPDPYAAAIKLLQEKERGR